MATLKRATQPPTSPATGGPRGLEALGLVMVLVPLLLRATTGGTTLPLWDLDPMMFPTPMSGVGPALSMAIDVVVLLGAACLLWAQRARGRGVSAVGVGLASIGAVAVLWHAFANGGSLHDQRIGFSWLSAVFAGVAVFHAAGEAAVRRAMGAVLLGFLALLLLKSVHQVFIEHAQNVEDFRATREQVLAAHGWTSGSPSALAFERRLMQAEASGWFGLANVLATVASGLGVAGLGLLVAAWRNGDSPRWRSVGLAAIGGSGAVCVLLAGAKGGWLSFACGVGALVAFSVLARLPAGRRALAVRLASLVGPLAVVAALGMVAARGLVGERLGELSLLFRWFYAQGAARIFAEHPLWGVGPDGFQSAYSLAKPPLSVEDVISPHAVVWDWVATLGVFGVAWVALLMLAGVMAGRSAVAAGPKEADGPASRNEVRLALVIPALATVAAAFAELALRSPDAIVLRIAGLGAWCAAVFVVLHVARSASALRLPLAAGGVALLAHGQIDVAASFPASVGLFFVLVGLAAAGPGGVERQASRAGWALGMVPALLAVGVLVGAVGAYRWERRLLAAAEVVRPVAELGQRLRLSADIANYKLNPDLTPWRVLADLSAAVGRPVEPTQAGVDAAMMELESRVLAPAAAELVEAHRLQPADRRPLREASRLLLRLAELQATRGERDKARETAALAIATFGVSPGDRDARPELRAPDFRWAANLHERRAATFGDPADARTAIALHDSALSRDPYNLEHALKAFRLARELGEDSAAEWARRCLELDTLQRLDKAVKGLTDADRAAIEAAVKAGTPSPPTPGRP